MEIVSVAFTVVFCSSLPDVSRVLFTAPEMFWSCMPFSLAGVFSEGFSFAVLLCFFGLFDESEVLDKLPKSSPDVGVSFVVLICVTCFAFSVSALLASEEEGTSASERTSAIRRVKTRLPRPHWVRRTSFLKKKPFSPGRGLAGIPTWSLLDEVTVTGIAKDFHLHSPVAQQKAPACR